MFVNFYLKHTTHKLETSTSNHTNYHIYLAIHVYNNFFQIITQTKHPYKIKETKHMFYAHNKNQTYDQHP